MKLKEKIIVTIIIIINFLMYYFDVFYYWNSLFFLKIIRKGIFQFLRNFNLKNIYKLI
mgnify:CR=1 FL=1